MLMKSYTTDKIRNLGVIGHGGEGKTTLAEAMLFNSGAIDRFGKVEDGTTTTDYDQEEIKRQISISAALAPLEWNNHKINVIDIPGYFDFVGELVGGLRVADCACIIVGAVSGVAVGTEKAWDYCDEDRKSTRLNSSHVRISYAVFCLKKKKKKPDRHTLENI